MLEFNGLTVRATLAVREDGKIVGKKVTPEVDLYTEEQFSEFFAGLHASIAAANEEALPQPEDR